MSYLGIFLLLVGLILLAIGIVLLIVNRNDGMIKWWMWGLVAGGAFLFLVGLILEVYSSWYATPSVPVSTTSNVVTRRVEVVPTMQGV